MAFFFQHGERVSDGVRRIAQSELEQAIRELEATGPGDHERVHSVRKRTKKLRALLKLVRRSLGAGTFRADSRTLRAAARGLAVARQSAVLLASFDRLVLRYGDQIAPEAFTGIRARLERTQAAQVAESERSDPRLEAARLLRELLARVDDWQLSPDDFGLIQPGLRQTYARARSALRRAYQRSTDDAFHDFRKRSKDHWYHLRLLAPSWPGPLEAFAGELHRLSELLGDDHDLADLRSALIADRDETEGEPVGALLALIERRQNELRSEAHLLSERIFAERPKAVVRRLRHWFEAWNAEPLSSSGRNVHEVDDAPDDLGIAQDAHVPEPPRLD